MCNSILRPGFNGLILLLAELGVWLPSPNKVPCVLLEYAPEGMETFRSRIQATQSALGRNVRKSCHING